MNPAISTGGRQYAALFASPLKMHGDDEDHSHEYSMASNGAMIEYIRKMDNVILTTVGIDIGSSTSHLMFAKVHLRRKANSLSSQFIIVNREILWRSPIVITPFKPDNSIDADALKAFIGEAYKAAGLSPAQIDSGAVILTGEAIKKTNAEAIAQLFAHDSGKFVCASAGHHLECTLAANGSGAVALSLAQKKTVLHVDIGGGTTKLALIGNGEILGTCAIAVGGRLMVQDADGKLIRIDDAVRTIAAARGLKMAMGCVPDPDHVQDIIASLVQAVAALIRQQPVPAEAEPLFLTARLPKAGKIDVVTFSGGVSEYIYGREARLYGDIGKFVAEGIVEAFRNKAIELPIADPGQGIRATVIGASQFTVQVSGKTIFLSDSSMLPMHNVPVLSPALDLDQTIDVAGIAARIAPTLLLAEGGAEQPVAIALKWRGEPIYWRLRNLAEGLVQAFREQPVKRGALILIVDGDVAQSLAHIMKDELGVQEKIIVVDGIELRAYDYVDLGELILPANVIPVVIKSLLFSAGV
ncbi:reactivating factor for ethanolamine ammonia lyase [Oxalobacteraceae bacterium CAVE-383]|nr:reactivating factor for ethanolamine ammonia lyase [Oxalobacteraceae bacterium CAVE-383]